MLCREGSFADALPRAMFPQEPDVTHAVSAASYGCEAIPDAQAPVRGMVEAGQDAAKLPLIAMVIAALVVSIVSAFGSVGAVWYARRSADSSAKSAEAAKTTAALESQRRHAELTPRFRVTCQPANPGSEGLSLAVFLAGPPDLERLDALTVTIRDDHPWRGQGTPLAGGPTPEQVAAQIWGPYRFVPGTGPGASSVRGISGADPTGRTTPTGGMPVGEELPFALEPTWPPSWSDQPRDNWRRERGTVVRLLFECHRDGLEPWTLTGEVDTTGPNVIEIP